MDLGPRTDSQPDVYLNYPVHQSVQLTYANGTVYNPTLMEAVLAEDETTSYPNRVPAFHGYYFFTGSASAEYVYVGKSIRKLKNKF